MATKSMARWEQLGDLLPLRSAIDRLFEDSFIRPASWLGAVETGLGVLPVDMYEEGDNLIVKASLPGLKPEEVNIQVQGDVLTISGESKQERESQDKVRNYQLREQTYGRLERSVALPVAVTVDKAEAVFADGILTLTLPKTEESRAKQIAIKVNKKEQKAA